MLNFLGDIATKLQPFRRLSYLLAALLVGFIITQLLKVPSQNQVAVSCEILSFVGCIWLLLFNILLSIFQNIPSEDNCSLGFLARVKIKTQRFFYHLLALMFITLTLIIVFLSFRMLRI
ncbi:hypothetical protein GAB14E_0068 [Colwellia psychrerythraea]|uniref:Uncharacterized protein n=1 Tax=Colwellia psychrerythraea TaxID=28229 RepID=A0A099KZX1_COLPS|nr:hypothetical protein GAB14E_0068 [Colwellia psychrerythraea]